MLRIFKFLRRTRRVILSNPNHTHLTSSIPWNGVTITVKRTEA